MTLLMSSLKMKIEKIKLETTGKFSPLFLDYLNQHQSLDQFYGRYPSLDSFKASIGEKQLSDESRQVLSNVLKSQYNGIMPDEAVMQNIESIKDRKTFTITTGHQLNIFSGPLYFIYKIVTVINTCKKLKEQYPDYTFVPVYWMASEDHDFEEISFFRLFNQKYTWESDQKGPVGRMNPDSLRDLINNLPEKVALFEEAYLQHGTLAEATRYFVNVLFGDEGLIVLDADSSDLKSLFKTTIKDDVFNHKAHDLVVATSEKLDGNGYKIQVNPREINFFYMEDGLRERILLEEGKFKINNTTMVFEPGEMEDLIDSNPEKFSPNVILRPLYQETILPNLAYIGGPGELAYWLQLKTVFAHYNTVFPILMPRNFCLYVNRPNAKKIQKAGLALENYFLPDNQLKSVYIEKFSNHTVELNREKEILLEVFNSIKNLALTVDKSLEGFIGAEAAKAGKNLDNIEKRLKKAEERKYEQNLKSLLSIKDRMFPEGNLQERSDNFLNFYINNPSFIKQLITHLDPFDYRFNLIIEDE